MAGHANGPEVDAPPRTGLVPLTWAQVTRNALNGLICLEKDCTDEKQFSFIDMVQYMKHISDVHPYIQTSFPPHVQEPTNFGNPDIPVSHSVQYSHHSPKDLDDSFIPYIPTDLDVSSVSYIPSEIVSAPSKSTTTIPYGHSVQSPSNVSCLKKTQTCKKKKRAPKPRPPLPYATTPTFRVELNTPSMSTLGVGAPDTTFHDDALILELSRVPVNTASSVPVNATPPNNIPTIADLPVVRIKTSPPKKKVNVFLVRLPRDIEATFHVYCPPPSSSHGSVSSQTYVGDAVAVEPSIDLPTHPPVATIPSVPNTRLRARRPATAFPTISNTRRPVLHPPPPILAIPSVPKKSFNVPLVRLPKDAAGKFRTYTQPSPPTKAVMSSPQTRASSPLFSEVEEPLDDTSPRGPSSLGTHRHDHPTLHNGSFELTMDGDMVMSPPLGPSSSVQEAHDPELEFDVQRSYLDDDMVISPLGPSSLNPAIHTRDKLSNVTFNNNSFAPPMDGDGDVAMSPPLGLSSLGQEANYPNPQDNPTLDNPYVKESGSDCILLTPTLTRFNLFFHSQYRMIHCRNKIGSEECNTAQLPYAVAGHLQSKHQYVFTVKAKDDLTAYIMTLKPVTDPETFVNPKPGLAPVKGLKIEKGFCCKKCSYAVRSLKAMRRHWSNDQKWEVCGIGPEEGRWQEGWVQNFFVVPMRFFSVEPSSARRSNAGEGDPFAIFLKTVVPVIEKESIQVLPDAIRPREVPPLVKMMEWHLHLADYITDRHKVQNLRTLVEPSLKRAKGSIPDLIHQAVFGYLDAVKKLHHGLTMAEKQLLFNPDDPSGRFTMHDEPATQRDYGYLLFIFVYAILTSRTTSVTDYRFPLTTSDHKSAERLMKAFENKRSNLEALEDPHSFLVPLFSPLPSAQDKWHIPLECFIALRCLCDDGLFTPSSRTTQVYAKLKYAIRCTCLFEANKRRADFSDSLYSAIKHYTKHMLSSESGTGPFVLITEAQKFTSSLALSQPSPPTTHVSVDGLTIFYKDTKFHVPSWRAGLRQMMDFVIASQDLLIGKADSFTIPDFIPDDWGKESRGYSWLNNADLGVHSYALVKNLMADPSNVSVSEDGSLVYNFTKLEKLLSDIGEITWTLMFLCYMLPGQVNRAEEFVEHKISNSTRPRTVLRSGLEMWLVIRCVKKENIVQRATFIPALVPPELRIQLERYLILIRPLERALATILYGPSTVHIYNEYLWVEKGMIIPAPSFTKAFRSAMNKYCGIEIGVHDYRQIVVQISQTYLGREVDRDDELEWDVLRRSVVIQSKPPVGSMHLKWDTSLPCPVKPFFGSRLPPKHGVASLGLFLEKVLCLCVKEIASLEARLQEKMGAISSSMENVAHSVSRTVEGMIQRSGHTFA
ncbi:hypothetical protein IW262DRAFT_1469135 [Armillaria fumosa]|nr:hypothetical protein IW262DRAFT_1469135 [Armillaria fumosa]